MFKVVALVLILVLFGVGIMYNKKILEVAFKFAGFSEEFIVRVLGKRLADIDTRLERMSNVRAESIPVKINNYFKEIIVNLDLTKDNVTPTGLVTFIGSISLAGTLVLSFFIKDVLLVVPMFFALFYFIVVVFRFMGLMKFEEKEAMIMDVEDYIASDIKDGVLNAVQRYHKSFHPKIRPYFDEFIDNVIMKGFGFKRSMLILNDQLGYTFNSFTTKALLYEEKADDDLVEIFSEIIETNRIKRELRAENNDKFNSLRVNFIVSFGLIMGFGLFSVFTDPYMYNFFLNTFLGKVFIVADLVLVAFVLSYIAGVKSKFID